MDIREMLKLDSQGEIPTIMKEGWARTYRVEDPIEECRKVLRRSDLEGRLIILMGIWILVGMIIGLISTLTSWQDPIDRKFALGGACWAVVIVMLGFTSFFLENKNNTGFEWRLFCNSLNNVRKWMVEVNLKSMDESHITTQGLKVYACDILILQAMRVLHEEQKTDIQPNETETSMELRRVFRFKHRVLVDFGLIDPDRKWNAYYDPAQSRRMELQNPSDD